MPEEQKSPSASKLTDSNKPIPPLPADAVTRNESKASQAFRSFLRWAGIALFLFVLGIIAGVFLFYLPKSSELTKAEQDLATANATIEERQTEITSLENQISALSTLEETNLTLRDELTQAQRHIQLLEALTDVRSAQYALERDDSAAAKDELMDTAAVLTELQSLLDPEQAETVNALLSRLELAIGGLDSDPFAAQSDLEVLANGLLQLEDMLFGEP